MTEQTAYRTHTCGSLRKEHAGTIVTLSGWVHARRDHRSVLFLDLRDRYGLTQVVVSKETVRVPDDLEFHDEDVLQIEGTVAERPPKLINPNITTGEVELQATRITRLSAAKNPPFEITKDTDVNEDVRLAYRYLDLRRARLQRNILLRHEVTTLVRDYLNKEGFVEIETPLLTKTSPEGARDYLVPSRLHPGKFYALPQSPQQFKQLLMLAGFDRYYQIARALRDEDSRGDRQPEHTQIDLEMSFVREEEVRALVEKMYIHVVEACGKTIWKKPFPVFTHEEAIRQFGADKFDLREGEEKKNPDVFAFAWVVDFPLFEWEEEKKRFTFAHNPFSAPKEEHVEKLMRGEDLGSLRAQQYDLVCNGYELASGGVRISDPTVQRKVFEIMGLTAEQTEERFGHLLRAYEYGAPPHAGMAPGLDRLIMLLANEPNIREVIAFPKNQKAEDVLFNAPSDVDPEQLKELHIKTDLPKVS